MGPEMQKKSQLSSRIHVRCDSDVLAWAKTCAKRNGVSTARILRQMLRETYDKRKKV